MVSKVKLRIKIDPDPNLYKIAQHIFDEWMIVRTYSLQEKEIDLISSYNWYCYFIQIQENIFPAIRCRLIEQKNPIFHHFLTQHVIDSDHLAAFYPIAFVVDHWVLEFYDFGYNLEVVIAVVEELVHNRVYGHFLGKHYNEVSVDCWDIYRVAYSCEII